MPGIMKTKDANPMHKIIDIEIPKIGNNNFFVSDFKS